MAEALEKRGVPDPAASLAAELGVLAFARWNDPAEPQASGALARQALHELWAATAALDRAGVDSALIGR
ncbi:hypothetical protein [Actinoallomurus iriomotensis]|uniref:Uncharacterized protein n=1 Tax=Actinoallomurus iriomotensis TaxID=478107 RepID=A0A9W6VX80_9ACTN|nr:hypothetical protein [Actinoallomurus iriomotensis]GLY82372.1 hypothetical protein Airi02_003040 [Actinoallomurus iriomotensis]